MNRLDYFVANRDAREFYPLASYLPMSSASVARVYIEQLTAPGDLVLVPFAATPTIARTAHALGRRVIAVEANPLWAWLARTMATLPGAAAIDAALARLGDVRKDDTTLRAHLTQLYTTTCSACQHPTPAEYFVHTRGVGITARHYTCAHCGTTRTESPDESDLQRAAAFQTRGLHFHLAFERVVPADSQYAERVRKMLQVYTPRNLYALVTLTQKIDFLFHATREREWLLLLLLHLLDRGTSFYADAALETRAQLTAHKQFIEFNLWRELELAARELGQAAPPLDMAASPREVQTTHPFVGLGSARSLVREIAPGSAALIIGALPSRRVAVWALSYLWGAWILGRTAVQPLTAFLDSGKDVMWERRWYLDALSASLDAFAKLARAEARVVFMFSETWHEVIEALLLASAGAQFDLETFLYQTRLDDCPKREFDDVRGEYRVTFTRGAVDQGAPHDARALETAIRASALAAAQALFVTRGEPQPFSRLHHAAYVRLAREGLLAQAMRTKFRVPPGKLVHDAVIAGLRDGYAHDFDHYQTPTEFWWLRRAPLDAPLVERVEEAVYALLAREQSIACEALEDAIYRAFPGDLTPDAGMVAQCAAAYAEERQGVWRWRAESPETRAEVLAMLKQLGERMECEVSDATDLPLTMHRVPFDLMWLKNGRVLRAFVWRTRAGFADLAQIQIAPVRGYIVLPETLVAWMRVKTQRLPHIAEAYHDAGWNFLRVPFIEQLLAKEIVEPSDLALIEGLTPPVAAPRAQLELL